MVLVEDIQGLRSRRWIWTIIKSQGNHLSVTLGLVGLISFTISRIQASRINHIIELRKGHIEGFHALNSNWKCDRKNTLIVGELPACYITC